MFGNCEKKNTIVVVREDLMGVEEEEAEDRDCWRFRLDCMRFMANL